jgi:hypothetical protein
VGKYRDALLHACEDLQSPLLRLCDGVIPHQVQDANLTLVGQEADEAYIYLHLIYLIGRFFCWTYIALNDIQSLHYTLDTTITNIMTTSSEY